MFRNIFGEDAVINLKELKQYGGNLDEAVAGNLKEVVNLYGIKVTTYTEYDKQPEVGSVRRVQVKKGDTREVHHFRVLEELKA